MQTMLAQQKAIMKPTEKLNLEAVIDANPVSRFQVTIIVLCTLVAMFDGFDTQSIAFVAPEIAASWHIPPHAFGMVFGAGLFGGLVGAILFGMAGDRFGRRPTLLLAIVLLAVGSLITPLADSIFQLSAIRFATGLGLGGGVPLFVALTAEYAPKRLRTTLVAVMFCGFPMGAVLGGIASAKLIPAFGWPSVFIAGGVLPLLLLPFFVAFAPESVRFFALRKNRAAIERILRRMNCADAWNGSLSTTAPEASASVVRLFNDGKAVGTFLLWATYFMGLLMTYFLASWIPVFARQSGLSIQTAVTAAVTLNLGSVFGCLIVGRLADRFGPAKPIASAFALGAVAIASIGQVGTSGPALCALTFVAGALSLGSQMCTTGLCASFYHTSVRATGLGWSLGVGRVGAIVGPVLGGTLLAAGTEISTLFVFVGLSSIAAAACVFAIGRYALPRVQHALTRVQTQHALDTAAVIAEHHK
ncbi:MFS transporter [Undibacterium arcticum]|uniref:MFS transporter n=1 Tax=Undibacterium arcticum TaxID=1762892 RepID=A0ABV7F7S6_9BURK